jgi:beta-lactamase superfamily II metal-dependent hydrolase
MTIYFIDVEGGQSTLIVTPEHQSLLVDAGYAGLAGRDSGRIVAALKDAGIERIDYLLITHFHTDHVGGVPDLAARIPVSTFIDYGSPSAADPNAKPPFEAYEPIRAKGSHIQPRPGERVPLRGIDVDVVSAGGELISKPLAGAGAMNPACPSFERHADDTSENARSLGFRLKYGRFVLLDLGDLNWNPLGRLVCPANLVGKVDVFLVPHHTNVDSTVPAMLAAIAPRTIVSNNGPTKGGSPEALALIHRLPGIDVWQLHRSTNNGAANSPDAQLANVDEGATGFWIKVEVSADGSYTVTNPRTSVSRTYKQM